MLKVNGDWVFDSSLLSDHINKFYSCLFDRTVTNNSLQSNVFPNLWRLDNEHSLRLVRKATLEEVRKVLFGMKRFRSSWGGGILATFYKKYWHVVDLPIINLVNSALET